MSSIENKDEGRIQAKPEKKGPGEDEDEIENGRVENGNEDEDEDPYKLARMHAYQLSVLSRNYPPVDNDLPIGTKDLPAKFQVVPRTLQPNAPKVHYGFGLYHIDCCNTYTFPHTLDHRSRPLRHSLDHQSAHNSQPGLLDHSLRTAANGIRNTWHNLLYKPT
ncbi:hypothetical protein DFJ43DRAFT_30532 [Lentinula guzmanii]|uniref:Uncharacterized protein n=1 Tax=Lentinula guzmanii TaxID=2804957 RepID=A0AA38JHC9_9AGAR|nr:hypothetical protein DFJ43DRAFT_30532 [Lentinula guzmanii]